jgi:ABC-type nitrate/sulfonate/bicarbonate transport system permease component
MTSASLTRWFEKVCRLVISCEMLAFFSAFVIQWGLYFAYKANDCSTRPFAAQVRQISLCLTHKELRLWSFANTALDVAVAVFWATVAGLGVSSLIAGYLTRRRKADPPEVP